MLAEAQGKSLQECQRTNTSTEFVLWQVYFEEKVNDFNVLHHYLAQIAAEVRRGNVTRPKDVELGQFLLKFTVTNAGGKTEQPKAPQVSSKRRWLKWLGLGHVLKEEETAVKE